MQESIWNSSNLQDRTLISRSQEGDQIAFEALVRKYRHHLSSLVHRHIGPAAESEDLLQLLFCKVYFSLKSFDIDRPFYPWLRQILINLCSDEKRRLRRYKARTFAELELEEDGIRFDQQAQAFDFYSAASRQEMNDMLRKVIKMLPQQYQEIITLHHLQQMPYEEISAILKCTPRAARIKAFRARAALRSLLEGSITEETNRSTSTNIFEKLDACCRRNLTKSSRPDRAMVA
jgi:RNA polymerase sigma-70 factor (ECF subfamily)